MSGFPGLQRSADCLHVAVVGAAAAADDAEARQHRVQLPVLRAELVRVAREPVEAIANAVGYEDAGFFSRLFRRKVNLTPAQYRRRFGSLRRVLERGARSRS